MSDEEGSTPSAAKPRLLPAIAAVLPIFFAVASCGLYGVTVSVSSMGGGASLWQSTLEMGPVAALLMLVTHLGGALGLSACLFFTARGVRVPAAALLSLASLPWLIGVAFEALGLQKVWGAVEFAEPSMRATLMAAGISEATMASLFGAVLGCGGFAAVALGLGLAGVARGAPRRSVLGALIGGALMLPVLGLTGYALLTARESGLILPLAGLGAVLASALGGFGIGSDEGGRSASRGVAAPIAAGLSVAMAGAAASSASFVSIFGALAVVSADERGAMLAASAAELAPVGAVATWGFPLGALAAAGLAGWSLTRGKPTVGQLVGAGAALLVVGVVLGSDALVAASAEAHVENATRTPWDAADGFTPAALPGEAAADPDLLLTPAGLTRLDGAGASGFERDRLVAALAPFATTEPGPEEDPSSPDFDRPPEVGVALDETVDAAGLRAFVDALAAAGITTVELQGRSRSGIPRESRDAVTEAFPALAEALGGRGAARIVVGASMSPRVAAADPVLRHLTLGAGVPDELEVRERANIASRRLDEAYRAYGAPAEPLYVLIGDGATGASLAELCGRAQDLVPVLVVGAFPGLDGVPVEGGAGVIDGMPDDPGVGERPIAGLVSILPLEEESGSGMFDPNLVTRSLRARSRSMRACYERLLRADPDLPGGRIVLRLTIQPTGTVSGVVATERGATPIAVAECAVQVARALRFSPGPEGGSVTFAYPITFTPTP